MSGRVDVLAAMDAAADEMLELAERCGIESADHSLRASRDAVAGLLDAIDRVFHEWDNIGPALEKLRYARSNIGGAA